MQEMLDKHICLIPAGINGWMSKGPAIRWFKYKNEKRHFPLDLYDFGNSIGADEGRLMSEMTMMDTTLHGIFRRANQKWKHQHGDHPFGLTYQERTPLD